MLAICMTLSLLWLHRASSQSLNINPANPTWRDTDTDRYLECSVVGGSGAGGTFSWTGPSVGDQGRVTIMNEGSSAKLFFRNLRPEDFGEYTCTHSSIPNAPVTSTVTIQVVPKFVPDQRTEYIVYEGDNVTLPCQAFHCTDGCGLTWWKGTRSLYSTSNTEGNIRTEQYSVTDVQQEDAGMYTCVISSQSNNELHFELMVIPHNERTPRLSKGIENCYQEVNYTQPLVLHCPVESGENSTENPMTISWIYTDIHQQPRHMTGPQLHIDPKEYTRGTYQCRATNNFGSDTLEIFIEINAPPLPAIVSLPAISVSTETPTITLEPMAPITPVAIHALNYIWEKSADSDLQWSLVEFGTMANKFTLTNRGELIIRSLQMSDGGLYRVTISNTFGHSVQTVHVEITPPPTPWCQPVDIAFTFKLPTTVSCSQVEANSNLLTDKLRSYLCGLNNTMPSVPCSDLEFTNVSIECSPENHQGSFSGTVSSRSISPDRMVRAFEENGEAGLNEDITIEPCGEGKCLVPTEIIDSLRDILLVLVVVVVVAVLVVVIATPTVVVLCLHKCKPSTKVHDMESGQRTLERSFSITNHNGKA